MNSLKSGSQKGVSRWQNFGPLHLPVDRGVGLGYEAHLKLQVSVVTKKHSLTIAHDFTGHQAEGGSGQGMWTLLPPTAVYRSHWAYWPP